MFASFDAELPAPTRLLLGISNSIRNYWYVYLIVIIGVVFLYRRFSNTKEGRLKIDQFKLKIPGFGTLNTKISMSRFASNMAVMLTSGVDIIQAVDIVEKVIGNEFLRTRLTDVKDGIRKGFGLGISMEQNGAFPPLVYQMISVGEDSGTLDYVLEKVSDFYETEVDTAVSQLTTIIEPVIIVFLGIVVAFIIISMLLPMFDMYSLIG
jgi:type IV pilus assembly protein PilC